MHIQHPLLVREAVEFRGFQANLARIAGERNTLVVVPTGLGKTVVAVLVLADLLKEGGKRVLILAPTKPLVEQHGRFLKEVLTEPWRDRVEVLTGHVAPAKREALAQGDVLLCATPQVIANDVVAGRLDMGSFDLIVFDEAHRASGDYPYTFLGQEALRHNPRGKRLGLTASPGHEVARIDEVRQHLGLSHVEIRTASDADVAPFVQETEVTWETLPLPPSLARVTARLEEVLAEKVRLLKGLGVLKGGSRPNRRDLLEAGSRLQAKVRQRADPDPSIYNGLSIQAQAMKVRHAIELAQTQGAEPFLAFAAKWEDGESKAARVLASDRRIQEAVQIARYAGEDNPKLERTAALIAQQRAASPDARAIVFTHYRNTCEQVAAHLATLDGVRPAVFVGQTKKDGAGMTQKQQAATVAAFKAGEHNVLVATSVAEEGLDIPDTDLVVFYEPIPSEIRAIQRRGRTGRHRDGQVVVLMTKGTADEAYHWSSRRKEQQMVKELHQLRATLRQRQGQSPPASEPPSTEVPAPAAGQTRLDAPASRPAPPAAPPSRPAAPASAPPSAPAMAGGARVVCDSREQAGGVVRALHEAGFQVEVRQLDVGDFVLSDRVAVERKEVKDFVDSLIDGRLMEQVKALTVYPKPLLVIEGDSLHGHRSISAEALHGAVASIAVDFGVPVLRTQDARETADLLAAVAKREQRRGGRKIAIRPGSATLTDKDRALHILAGLPGVDKVRAHRLLDHFGSLEGVFGASMEALAEVEGIGAKTAGEIRRIITWSLPGKLAPATETV
ncbi:MAG: DEAD/DEAH box helicase [Thermoplasmatota archaeon]